LSLEPAVLAILVFELVREIDFIAKLNNNGDDRADFLFGRSTACSVSPLKVSYGRLYTK
jgi:hypothetical protein